MRNTRNMRNINSMKNIRIHYEDKTKYTRRRYEQYTKKIRRTNAEHTNNILITYETRTKTDEEHAHRIRRAYEKTHE